MQFLDCIQPADPQNHTMHLIAIAQAAGLSVTWNDFAALSKVTPLIARVYPNGAADVNHFHAAGGMGYVMQELLDAGLLIGDALSMTGRTIAESISEPTMIEGRLQWVDPQQTSLDPSILKPCLLYTSPSPRDREKSRMPSSA